MKISKRRFVVTGGCGFIGAHLVKALLDSGAEKVVVIDSMQYGSRDRLDLNDPRIAFLKFTIGKDSFSKIKRHFSGCDTLFHLAAQKHNQSIRDPYAVYNTNITGTADLFELAGANKIRKVVFTSSLYAYGSMSLPPMRETQVPKPSTIYGISKLCGEHLLAHYGKKFGFEFVSLRLFFVYGPYQYPGMGYKSVIVKNFGKLLRNESPTICGDGRQTLDYVYIDDVVDALIRASRSKLSGMTFNVGSGQGTSITDLTLRMIAVSKKTLKPTKIAADWTAGSARVSNVSSVKSRLKWAATTSLTEGLKQTYDWLKSAQHE